MLGRPEEALGRRGYCKLKRSWEKKQPTSLLALYKRLGDAAKFGAIILPLVLLQYCKCLHPIAVGLLQHAPVRPPCCNATRSGALRNIS